MGGVLLVLSPGFAAELDFEGIDPGTIVDRLMQGKGISGRLRGKVLVSGFNPDLGAGNNAAVVFDSANPPGIDFDLGTTNQAFGGPGIGVGGEAAPFQNDVARGNILIVNEAAEFVDRNNNGDIDNKDSPVTLTDDADNVGEFVNFDFSMVKRNGRGTVTLNSIVIMDVEREEQVTGDAIIASGPGIPNAVFVVPDMGDNGVAVIGPLGLDGVGNLRINLNGSGAIAAVVVNEKEPGVCWITTGGFQNAGMQAGSKDYTFGGNVGPPPSGVWEVIDHNTGDNFHSNDVHITLCDVIEETGPGQPGGKKGFEINRAFFEGTGRLNNVGGFEFTGLVIDAGEPQGKRGNGSDYFEIIVTDPNAGDAVVFQASATLDGGNVQIHPPNGGSDR